MTGIQWLLLILVAAAVTGAYFYLRRQGGDDPWSGMDENSGESAAPDRGESLDGDSYIVGVRTVERSEQASREAPAKGGEAADDSDEDAWQAFTVKRNPPEKSAEAPTRAESVRPQRPPAGERQLFVLHVASRDGGLYDGPDIHAALRAQGLQFGPNDIYHRLTEDNGVPESIYSVANTLKPGHLDPAEEDHLHTPGLTLILQLPGPIEGTRAARDMLKTAGALAERLGAEVLDEKRSLLKPQTAQYMLDEIAELDRKRRLARHR